MKRGRTARLLLSFLLVLILLAGLAPAPAEAYWVWDCFWDFFGEEEPPAEPLTIEQREENVRYVMQYLREELELPDSAVAAVMANIYRESAFDPRAVDASRGLCGLCQWSRTRWANCFLFCWENGLDRLSVEGQMAFLKHELKGEYRWIYDSYLLPAEDSEDGAQEAQYYFCLYFEAPLDVDWEQVVRSKLVAYAYWPLVSEGQPLDWS